MGRLPIRLRLTLAFTLVMAILLGGAGLLLRTRLASGLDASIDQSLRTRASDLSALVDAGGPVTFARESGDTFAQVIGRDGRVRAASPDLGRRPLVGGPLRQEAGARPVVIARTRVPGLDDPVRLLAVRAPRSGSLVVVGTSLESRDEAVANLTTLLVIGGPVALVLASIAGYLLTVGALRPVEAMRARAAGISGAGRGERLPVPPARDEIGRLGATLNGMLARVDAAITRERGFVADAGHELRTPLAIMKTELELALGDDGTPQQLRAAIASAREETDRLIRLAEDLLLIARSDQGRLDLRREAIEVVPLLERVRDRFAARAAGRGRSVVVGPGVPARIVADRLRVEQALGNLVENALVHGAGTVTLTGERRPPGVELHVRDQGPGPPEEFAPRAFERFTRADTARGRGGSGLGLAIVDAVAHAHGGRARITGGAGADAWIVLPDADADA